LEWNREKNSHWNVEKPREWNIEKNREKYRVLQKAKLVRSGDIALDTGP